MTFSDIFKSNFLENVTSVTVLDMVLAIVLSFCVGLFIFFVYKKTYSGVMYSAGFGVSLIAMTMITTLVILAVTSNVVLYEIRLKGSDTSFVNGLTGISGVTSAVLVSYNGEYMG